MEISKQILDIPNALTTYAISNKNNVIGHDVWRNPSMFSDSPLSVGDFSEIIINQVLLPIKRMGVCDTWIADFSESSTPYQPATLDHIFMSVFPKFSKNGIKYFVVILPSKENSSILTSQVKRFMQHLSSAKIVGFVVKSLHEAELLLKIDIK